MPDIDIPGFEDVELAPPMLDPGTYVFNIQEEPQMKTSDNDKQYLEVKLVCLEGPPQSTPDPATGSNLAAGRKMTDRLYFVDGAFFRVKSLLICAGLLKRDDKESDMARGKFNSSVLVGARLNCRIETNSYKNAAGEDREGRNVVYLT